MKAVAAETGHDPASLPKLRNFLLIIVNYIERGEGGPRAAAAQTYSDVKGEASKQAFLLMSRTDFASIYRLLTRRERRIFRRLVGRNVIVDALGVKPDAFVYVKGYGKTGHHRGPRVRRWLTGITKGRDLLSVKHGRGISGAQGRFGVDRREGKKHTGLVQFEARGSQMGAFAKADDWVAYAKLRFWLAKYIRPRKGSTRLK